MKKRLVCLAMLSAFASGSAWAESYRLAFSKSEQIEIFVEHAAGAAWCSPLLDMRVVYRAEPSQAALAGLMPKLGALLEKQCPQARDINWSSVDAQGKALARGTSSAAGSWALKAAAPVVAAVPIPAVEAVQSPAVAPAPAVAAAVEPKEAPAPAMVVETKEVSPAVPVALEVQVPPASVAVPEAKAVSALVKADVTEPMATPAAPVAAAPVAAAAAPVAVPAIVAPPVAPPVAAPAPQPAVAAPTADAVKPSPVEAVLAATPVQAARADFTVNGWKPSSEAQVMQQAKFLTTMQDQNGCKVVSRFELGDSAQYASLKSEGLQCGADGFATGKGRLILERSDGARLARTGELWFAAGIPFTKEVIAAKLAATDGNRILWFSLGLDSGSDTYYLLRAQPTTYGAISAWYVDPRVDVVTADESAFRQSDRIRVAVDRALNALETSAMPWAHNARLVFSSSFDKGIVKDEADHLLYAIDTQRPNDWRTGRAKGEWRYNLQSARNYLFQRDERLAQQKRVELAQEERRRRNELTEKAYKEGRNLQIYKDLVQQSNDDPRRLLASLQSDLRYEPGSGGAYSRLIGGSKQAITRVVRVSGRDGDDAKVDWPYDMRLVGQKDLSKKWYLIKGEATLDAKRRDDDKLPLTLVMPAPAGVYPCVKDGCADMADPLAIARLRLAMPEWTPEAAQAVIDLARQP